MGISDRKAREFQRREDDILKAAFDLFAEEGIESVTIEMIAEKAEVGKGTIYKHFLSKNEIFGRLIINQGHEMLETFKKIIKDEPVIVQCKKVLRLFWDMHVNDIRKFAVYRKCDQLLLMEDLGPQVLIDFNRINNEKRKMIQILIKRGIDEQIFKNEPLENMVAAALGLYMGVFDFVLAGEIQPSDSLYALMENMIFKGFIK